MERRINRLAALIPTTHEAVERCADFLSWAFRVTPDRIEAHASNVAALRGLVAPSGCPEERVPEALALALSRDAKVDVAQAQQCVDTFGVDVVLWLRALPPREREATILAQAALWDAEHGRQKAPRTQNSAT